MTKTLSLTRKQFVFSFRGFYWDYWRNVNTGEVIKFEMGEDPNEYGLPDDNDL